jgi:hypothetical protein
MDELFLETELGSVPISPRLVKKYHLKKGTKSPFTNLRIVDKNGDFTAVPKDENPVNKSSDDSRMFSTAEIIDFSQGADSDDAK